MSACVSRRRRGGGVAAGRRAAWPSVRGYDPYECVWPIDCNGTELYKCEYFTRKKL